MFCWAICLFLVIVKPLQHLVKCKSFNVERRNVKFKRSLKQTGFLLCVHNMLVHIHTACRVEIYRGWTPTTFQLIVRAVQGIMVIFIDSGVIAAIEFKLVVIEMSCNLMHWIWIGQSICGKLCLSKNYSKSFCGCVHVHETQALATLLPKSLRKPGKALFIFSSPQNLHMLWSCHGNRLGKSPWSCYEWQLALILSQTSTADYLFISLSQRWKWNGQIYHNVFCDYRSKSQMSWNQYCLTKFSDDQFSSSWPFYSWSTAELVSRGEIILERRAYDRICQIHPCWQQNQTLPLNLWKVDTYEIWKLGSVLKSVYDVTSKQ